jgi:hypothetical protein
MPKQLQEFAHPEYLDIQEEYVTIRDCYNGSKAIKSAGERYLPRLGSQDSKDYENYKRRALFFPITSKTVATLVGYATVKDPETEYDPELEPYFSDGIGSFQFTEFYIKLITEVTLMGRIGVLIDAPVTGSRLPNLLTYAAEHIINWSTFDDGSIEWVLLRETIYVQKPNSKFGFNAITQYRWCGLRGGQYTVEVLDDNLELVSSTVPLFRGSPLNYVPFICIGTSGIHMDVDRPPMLDISTINISHYMTSADLEWGRHFVGLPTPVVIGVDASTVLKIGGTTAWVLPTEGSDAKYLEFLGQGLGSLENALKEKIGLMASMSARLVDSSTKGSEAADTVRLRYLSETASLKQLVLSVQTGMIMIYTSLAKMIGVPAPTVEMNKDFLTTRLEAGIVRELFNAYFQGAITKETLVYNLKKSELLDPKMDEEEVMAGMMTPEQIAAMNKPPVPAKPQPTKE